MIAYFTIQAMLIQIFFPKDSISVCVFPQFVFASLCNQNQCVFLISVCIIGQCVCVYMQSWSMSIMCVSVAGCHVIMCVCVVCVWAHTHLSVCLFVCLSVSSVTVAVCVYSIIYFCVYFCQCVFLIITHVYGAHDYHSQQVFVLLSGPS